MDWRELFSGDYRRKLKIGAIALALGVGSAAVGALTVIVYQVYFGDDSELKKSAILARINEETTIFTLDEQTRIGSFFDNSHRSYVEVDRIPVHMVRAMVAAEDKNFYEHVGIDPFAIATAFFEGIGSGMRFKRGGSTLTQQTVKNIMDRREHTFTRKFKEMIRALQLERMYSKNQILEFYLNQFHVTANGRGIGIAAQYYFNKDVSDLTLVEAAFIAGSVKAPNKYNPFVKNTEEEKAAAWREADARKNYVIKRMYREGWISEEEFKKAWDERVPFKQGKFGSSEVAMVTLIRSQVNKPEILEQIGLESIADLENAGLRIYTTIDADLQEQAQLNLRRNLARLETVLKGFHPEDKSDYKSLRDLEVGQFYFGKVLSVERQGTKFQINMDFGLPKGVVPYESIERTAKFLDLVDFQGYQSHVKEIGQKIKPGDILFAEVKEYNDETHQAVLELKQHPSINGGIIAIDKGEVRAMVAGFDPKGFNRAMFSTRQPGSVYKSVVYFAGLQLGWTITDRLDNDRRVFPFQGKFYYPRPDHISPFRETSMIWSGVKSENLASVYLTAHLLDKLNFGQFKALLGSMNLLPFQGEAPRDFHYRVAKETGVQLDNIGIREHLLNRILEDLRPDLIFAGKMDVLDNVSRMWWGRGYLAELQNLYAMGGGHSDDLGDKEMSTRVGLIKNNYERMTVLANELGSDWAKIQEVVNRFGAEGVFADSGVRNLLDRFRVLTSNGSRPDLGYMRTLPDEVAALANAKRSSLVLEPPPGRSLNPLDVQAIWGDAGAFGEKANITVNDVKLNGYLPLSLFYRIRNELEERTASVMAREDTFSLFRYFNHHDFRIILGLRYLVDLTKAMGVYSKMEPVLSFPLGTNVVSVAEVAKVYQTFTNGQTYRYYKDGPPNQLNFIRRIEDRDGNILFEAKREDTRIVDECVASQLTEILSKVVTHGTGSRARSELHVDLAGQNDKASSIRVPAYGKTGTTNDYTTAYFAGFLPYPTTAKAPLEVANSYTIASYVGYDLNKSMRRGGYKISGAYGGLPVWTDFAKAVIEKKKYADFVDGLDIGVLSKKVWPVKPSTCGSPALVDLPQGAVIGADSSGGDEVFAATNFDKEGESRINEFESSNIRSIVKVVQNREFKPFAREKKEQRSFEETADPTLDKQLDGGDKPTNANSLTPQAVREPVRAQPERTPEAAPPPPPAPAEVKKNSAKEELNPLERSLKKLNEFFQSGKKEEKPKNDGGNPPTDKEPQLIPKEKDQPEGFKEEDLW